MSASTVRYGVTFNNHGRRIRLKAGYDAGKVFVTTSRMTAMAEAVKLCRDHEEPRIVKLTRKAKPKVVAKLVLNCTADRGTGLGRVSDWRDDRHGKRIRITLEELES